MQRLLRVAAILFLACPLFAQITVTATVVDPNGNPYANGTVSGQSVAASGQATYYTSPTTTANTGFFSLSLPKAATWVFSICAPPVQLGPTVNPTPKQVCFSSQPILISASADISALVTANVTIPILGPAPSSGSTAIPYPNSSGGTTCNGLAKVDQTVGSSTYGKAVNTAATDELPILGVVTSGCGNSGSASITATGLVQVIFDSASITVGNAVGISNTNAAQATDLGSAAPTSSSVIVGTIVLSPAGALPSGCTSAPGCWILLKPAGAGGNGGGGGSPNAVVTNPASTATNTIVPTAASTQPITASCNSGAAAGVLCMQAKDASGNQVLGVVNNDSVVLGKVGGTVSIGSGTSSNTDLDGTLTMSGGTATYTFSGSYGTHPMCTASDETSIAAVKVTYTGVVSVTFTTAGASDVVDYHCLARN